MPTIPKKKRVRKPLNRSILPTLASMKTGSRQLNPIAWIRDGNDIRVMRKQLFTFGPEMPSEVIVDCRHARSLINWCQANDFVKNEHIMRCTVGVAAFRIWCNEHSIDDADWPLSMRSLYLHLSQDDIITMSLYIIYKTGYHTFCPVPIAFSPIGESTFKHKTRGIQPIHCTVLFENEKEDAEELAQYDIYSDDDEYAPPPEPEEIDEDEYIDDGNDIEESVEEFLDVEEGGEVFIEEVEEEIEEIEEAEETYESTQEYVADL